MLPKRKKILIFPAGAENAIEVYNAIRSSVHIRVVPASSRDDISELVYEEPVIRVPEMNDPEFLAVFTKLVDDNGIDIIIPTHDSAMLFLAEHSAQINAKIANSDLETNRICRSKRLTYQHFAGASFNPSTHDTLTESTPYPLFAKPDDGQGAKGVKLIANQAEHSEVLNNPNMVVVEHLPGEEITIDCFTNRLGELCFIGPRWRTEIRMGISFRSLEAELTKEISSIANSINRQLKLRGLWFFQLKEDQEGKLKLLEVCTRAAGTGGFFRHKGVNLPLLTIFDLLGQTTTISPQSGTVELFRTTKNLYRYNLRCDRIYVDLDDTLIIEGQVNHELMGFLYKAANKGKELFLITKHDGDLLKTLAKKRISPLLFNDILHLEGGKNKSDYISGENSILIDNWYLEREQVRAACGIPVFDVDAVESLKSLL